LGLGLGSLEKINTQRELGGGQKEEEVSKSSGAGGKGRTTGNGEIKKEKKKIKATKVRGYGSKKAGEKGPGLAGRVRRAEQKCWKKLCGESERGTKCTLMERKERPLTFWEEARGGRVRWNFRKGRRKMKQEEGRQ